MNRWKRPSWDEYFAKIAEDVSKRSTCIKDERQFGAVIVNEKREIVATGYNGVVRGAQHCEEIGCIKNDLDIESGMGHGICPAAHAEQNALIQAGKLSKGSTLYINGYPCRICARLVVNAGIKRAVMSGIYSDEEGLKILKDADVDVAFLKE